jgi:hypothetical protein
MSQEHGLQLLETMRSVVTATPTWARKSARERLDLVERASTLAQQVEETTKSGGAANPLRQCGVAAIQMKLYVIALNDLSRIYEGQRKPLIVDELYGPAYNAFDFGRAFEECKVAVEALPATAPKGR